LVLGKLLNFLVGAPLRAVSQVAKEVGHSPRLRQYNKINTWAPRRFATAALPPGSAGRPRCRTALVAFGEGRPAMRSSEPFGPAWRAATGNLFSQGSFLAQSGIPRQSVWDFSFFNPHSAIINPQLFSVPPQPRKLPRKSTL